jgi:subtilisin family serine protease
MAVFVAAVAVFAAQAFPNPASDAAEQWYLAQDRAWDHWSTQPRLATVRVAVIDSGIDYGHPDFRGQIVAGRSFVGGSWKTDSSGHGTFVAGIIAANAANGVGIAGIAFNAKLLIAKVAQPDGSVSPRAEAQAIRWAVREGARVINVSLGGVRDPGDLSMDKYSQLERDAVEYANSRGVLVVAAAGNGTQAPKTPWGFADYPAALPNVLGVAALRKDGSVPDFSNRDPIYVDIAAPGAGIFSTIPRKLLDTTNPSCTNAPYSNCGPLEFQNAIGTSFAAPQVAAAAALLIGEDPRLAPDQLAWILERSATDVNASNGCSGCAKGRDPLTGWGRLDIARALAFLTNGTKIPAPVSYRPNDDIRDAYPLNPLPRALTSSLDYWDDPINVYAVTLTKDDQLIARLTGLAHRTTTLTLWKPGTLHIDTSQTTAGHLAAKSSLLSNQQRLRYHAPLRGTYYLEVKLGPPRSRARSVYHLSIATQPIAKLTKN